MVEPGRASWLVEILEAANALSRIVPHVLESLAVETDELDLAQQCEIAGAVAARGDRAARRALYAVLERVLDPAVEEISEVEVVRVDGIEGLLHVARRRGARLRASTSGDHWIEPAVQVVEEAQGREAVARALAQAALGDPDVRVFCEELESLRASRPNAPDPEWREARARQFRVIPAATIIRAIAENDPGWQRGDYQPWGMYAEPSELLALQDAMFSEPDARKLAKFLTLFMRRALPRFDSRLIDYTEHPDEEVRFKALRALGRNSHTEVRRHALEGLRRQPTHPELLRLLKHNYEHGDAAWIQAALVPQALAAESHQLVWSLLEIYEENHVDEGLTAMLFAYEETPCLNCRGDVVEWLVDMRLLPDALREECRFDADSAVRKAVAESAEKTQ